MQKDNLKLNQNLKNSTWRSHLEELQLHHHALRNMDAMPAAAAGAASRQAATKTAFTRSGPAPTGREYILRN